MIMKGGRIFVFVLISVICSSMAFALTDCTSSCTDQGSYLECTGTLNCDYLNTAKGILVTAAAMNGYGSPGNITLISDGWIKINNSVLNGYGTNGGTGSGGCGGCTCNQVGGAGAKGGDGFIMLKSNSSIEINNSELKAYGGNGGRGANCGIGSCGAPPCTSGFYDLTAGSGGNGGKGEIIIEAESFILGNVKKEYSSGGGGGSAGNAICTSCPQCRCHSGSSGTNGDGYSSSISGNGYLKLYGGFFDSSISSNSHLELKAYEEVHFNGTVINARNPAAGYNIINITTNEPRAAFFSTSVDGAVTVYCSSQGLIVGNDSAIDSDVTFDSGCGNITYQDYNVYVNKAPTAVNLVMSCSDSMNRTSGSLQAGWDFEDTNGDTEQAHETKWYKNDIATESNSTTVSSSNTVKGQTWYFSVRVFDGMYWSSWVDSSKVVIENTIPSWTAIPNKTIYQDFATFVHVNLDSHVSDADNDAVNYTTSYDSNMIGCAVDGNDIELSSVSGKSGLVLCEVTGDDGEGSSSATFYVNITKDSVLSDSSQTDVLARRILANIATIPTIMPVIDDNANEKEFLEQEEETIFEKVEGFEEEKENKVEIVVKKVYGYAIDYALIWIVFLFPALILAMLTNRRKIISLREKVKEGVENLIGYFFEE